MIDKPAHQKPLCAVMAYSVGAILVTSSFAKASFAFSEGYWFGLSLRGWFTAFLPSTIEISLASCLIASPYSRRVWCATTMLFCIFLAISLRLYQLRVATCDCFGRLPVQPAVMIWLDMLLLVGSGFCAYQLRKEQCNLEVRAVFARAGTFVATLIAFLFIREYASQTFGLSSIVGKLVLIESPAADSTHSHGVLVLRAREKSSRVAGIQPKPCAFQVTEDVLKNWNDATGATSVPIVLRNGVGASIAPRWIKITVISNSNGLRPESLTIPVMNQSTSFW